MVQQSVRARAGMWLESSHAAKILGVTERMVRFYVKSGLLPNRRRGLKVYIFSYDEVLRARAAREHSSEVRCHA